MRILVSFLSLLKGESPKQIQIPRGRQAWPKNQVPMWWLFKLPFSASTLWFLFFYVRLLCRIHCSLFGYVSSLTPLGSFLFYFPKIGQFLPHVFPGPTVLGLSASTTPSARGASIRSFQQNYYTAYLPRHNGRGNPCCAAAAGDSRERRVCWQDYCAGSGSLLPKLAVPGPDLCIPVCGAWRHVVVPRNRFNWGQMPNHGTSPCTFCVYCFAVLLVEYFKLLAILLRSSTVDIVVPVFKPCRCACNWYIARALGVGLYGKLR